MAEKQVVQSGILDIDALMAAPKDDVGVKINDTFYPFRLVFQEALPFMKTGMALKNVDVSEDAVDLFCKLADMVKGFYPPEFTAATARLDMQTMFKVINHTMKLVANILNASAVDSKNSQAFPNTEPVA